MSRHRATVRALLVAVGLMSPLVATTLPAHAATTVTYRESFESGFGSWTPDTDGNARAWSITRELAIKNAIPPVDGAWQLSYFLDGTFDDGTIWIERTIQIPAGDVQVDVAFWLRSTTVATVNTWPVVGYAGPKNPTVEQDLPIIGRTEQAVGWKQYRFHQSFPKTSATRIYVAVGISATWETPRVYPVDLVEITVTS